MATSTKPDPGQTIAIALGLIRKFEGCKLIAYPDPGTGGKPWTIGWGATGPEIVRYVCWTQEQADLDLECRVLRLFSRIHPLLPAATSGQLAAAISFCYNCGFAAFRGSTWLRQLKRGDAGAASKSILRWNKSKGRAMAGLTRRRKAEAAHLIGVS